MWGHDSMFYKYSKQMVTTLVAKDRVLAHNPCGAIYCAEGYYKRDYSESIRSISGESGFWRLEK